MRVLLAEDHQDLALVIVELLTEEGHAVIHVPDLLAAQRVAEQGTWDLVLVDGLYTSARELSEEQRAVLRALAARAPVVVQSGGQWAAQMRPEELGVTTILQKPYNLDLLLETVRSVDSAPCRLPR